MIKKYLKKTIEGLRSTSNAITNVLSFNNNHLNPDDYELIERILIESDIGFDCTDGIITHLKTSKLDKNGINQSIYAYLKDRLSEYNLEFSLNKNIVLVGVNGVGKTTTCAKLANHLKEKKISLVAADTYRAAAISQLIKWSQNIKVNIYYDEKVKDPASIVYSSIEKSGFDHLIIDTAGRLHTSTNLMMQLEKIIKIIDKSDCKSITTILVVDGSNGQNIINQIDSFLKHINLDGIIITKLDGTSRGGIVIPIIEKFKIPIAFMGIGENAEDIIPFNLDNYLKSLFNINEQS